MSDLPNNDPLTMAMRRRGPSYRTAIVLACCRYAEEHGAMTPAIAAAYDQAVALGIEGKIEILQLADGPVSQLLVPGVEPVAEAARDLDDLQRRRAARRGAAALPAGGLFDECARTQLEMF